MPSTLGQKLDDFARETETENLQGKLLWLSLNGIEGRDRCKAWLAGLTAYKNELME